MERRVTANYPHRGREIPSIARLSLTQSPCLGTGLFPLQVSRCTVDRLHIARWGSPAWASVQQVAARYETPDVRYE